MKLFLKFYMSFLSGTHLRYQERWGEKSAIFFTEFSASIFICILLSPLVIYCSHLFDLFDYVPFLFLFVGSGLMFLIKKMLLSNNMKLPDINSLNRDEIKKKKFVSEVVFYLTLGASGFLSYVLLKSTEV